VLVLDPELEPELLEPLLPVPLLRSEAPEPPPQPAIAKLAAATASIETSLFICLAL
jgi:hypothetical protein